jgi:hypothetical protein
VRVYDQVLLDHAANHQALVARAELLYDLRRVEAATRALAAMPPLEPQEVEL